MVEAFVISCTMALGKKLAAFAAGHVSDKMSDAAEEKGYTNIVKILRSELHTLSNHIQDTSVAHFRSAVSNLDSALTNINSRNETSSIPQESSQLARTLLDPPQYLSDTANRYIGIAEQNAQDAFSNVKNVPFTMRISAIQIKAQCIGLQLAEKPKELGDLWKKSCLDQVLQDKDCKNVIADEQKYREGKLVEKISRKADKWQKVSSFCRDIFSALIAISPNADYTDGIVDYYKSLSIFNLVSEEVIESADSFEIKSYFIIRENGYRINIDAPNQAHCLADSLVQMYAFRKTGARVNSLTCLPDGSLVFATDSGTVFKYSDKFQKLVSTPLEREKLIYDPLRKSIWCWSNGDPEQIEIKSDDLCKTGFKLPCPTPFSNFKASITKSGWLITWYRGSNDTKVWARNTSNTSKTEPLRDTKIEFSRLLPEQQKSIEVDHIAITDHASTKDSDIIKLALLTKRCVVIRTLELRKDKNTYDLKPGSIVYEFLSSNEMALFGSCVFNCNGDLIIYANGKIYKIYNYGLGPVDVSDFKPEYFREVRPKSITDKAKGFSKVEVSDKYEETSDHFVEMIIEAEKLWACDHIKIYCEDISFTTSNVHKTGKSEINNIVKVIDLTTL